MKTTMKRINPTQLIGTHGEIIDKFLVENYMTGTEDETKMLKLGDLNDVFHAQVLNRVEGSSQEPLLMALIEKIGFVVIDGEDFVKIRMENGKELIVIYQ